MIIFRTCSCLDCGKLPSLKLTKTPLKIGLPKTKVVSQTPIFRGKPLLFGRVSDCITLHVDSKSYSIDRKSFVQVSSNSRAWNKLPGGRCWQSWWLILLNLHTCMKPITLKRNLKSWWSGTDLFSIANPVIMQQKRKKQHHTHTHLFFWWLQLFSDFHQPERVNKRKGRLSVFFSAEVRAISHGSYDLASWALQQAEVPMARGWWVASAEVVGVEIITGSEVMRAWKAWMLPQKGFRRGINIPIFQEWYPCI